LALNIMLVDDSAFMRNMLKNLVAEAGHKVVGEASDGQQAIQKYQEIKPNLVFMDIMMPVMNGIDALKGIIAQDKNAKVVMCTSVGQEKVVNEAVEAGASDFIVKPFTKDDVQAIIKKYAGQ
jgi:two-component system, chemotaxis family, chemotaxis protein CheY